MTQQRSAMLTLIGQAPSRNGDPMRPLEGMMAKKLAYLFGCAEHEYLACTQRLNVLGHFCGKTKKGDRFPLFVARVNANRIRYSLGGCRVLFIGVGTARAFGIIDKPLSWRRHLVGNGETFNAAVIPHTSGINRWWNDESNKRKARRFCRRAWTLYGRKGAR